LAQANGRRGDDQMNHISDQLVINNLRLRNRLAMPALTTNSAGDGGVVTEAVKEFYRTRSGSVGLVIVEAAAVRSDGRLVRDSIGLWDDNQVEGMRALAELIKAQGAAAVVQLNHAGARCIPLEGPLAGASPSGFEFRSDVPPLVLNEAQIEQLIEDYASAAWRAVQAGFDGVEVHGAHFYLLSQFISPFTNKRTDCYGGDTAGRARFALDVVKAVREKIGPDEALLFRLNAVEAVEGGQTLEGAAGLARLLASGGVDLLDVSFAGDLIRQETDGVKFAVFASALGCDDPCGANLAHAEFIKKEAPLPVIAVGKLWNKASVDAALGSGNVDIIAVGRQLIADPCFADKLLSDRVDEVETCRECLLCFKSIRSGVPLKCAAW
jgi:2,4-dienoyl-CoA reductase-like NADH-dependent reductase (Old Yellow Enzyme family)